MGQRSKILSLPEAVRAELDRRLVDSGFANYRELTEWLEAQGYQLSKSAVHSYGQKFEGLCAAIKVSTEQARAIVESTHDDANMMGDALVSLVQQKTFEQLKNLNLDEIEPSSLHQIGRMVADLNRAAVNQKKWQSEVRAKAQAAAKAVRQLGEQEGLGKKTLDQIVAQIKGVAA